MYFFFNFFLLFLLLLLLPVLFLLSKISKFESIVLNLCFISKKKKRNYLLMGPIVWFGSRGRVGLVCFCSGLNPWSLWLLRSRVSLFSLQVPSVCWSGSGCLWLWLLGYGFGFDSKTVAGLCLWCCRFLCNFLVLFASVCCRYL